MFGSDRLHCVCINASAYEIGGIWYSNPRRSLEDMASSRMYSARRFHMITKARDHNDPYTGGRASTEVPTNIDTSSNTLTLARSKKQNPFRYILELKLW